MDEPSETQSLWDQVLAFLVEFDWIYRIGLVVLIAILLRWVLLFLVRKIVARVVYGVKTSHGVEDTQALIASPLSAVRVVQRTRTLGSVLSNIITWLIIVFAAILILDQLGFSVTALVASAGVIGAALAFGAQNVIKDALNGLFLVFEDQLGVGDVVDVGPATGVAEAVGIRVTEIRDVNGTLWYVRNGEILRVGNMSQGWARVILDLAVPYHIDLDQVQDLLLDTANSLAEDPLWRSKILEKPEVWGLESISADAVVVRLVVKTRSSAKDAVARELRIRIKTTLDQNDIKLPSLNSITLTGFDGATSVRSGILPRTNPIPVKPPRGTKPKNSN